MPARLLLLFALITAAAGAAVAGDRVYRWTDARGHLHFGDTPAPDAQAVQEVNTRTGTKTDVGGPVDDSDEAAAARRADQCAARKAQYETYLRSTRLVEKDSLGREREYTAEERDRLLALTQEEIARVCVDSEPAEPG